MNGIMFIIFFFYYFVYQLLSSMMCLSSVSGMGRGNYRNMTNRKPAAYFTSFRLRLLGGKLKTKKKKGHLILV